jgi:hypothetical protein
MPQDNTTNRDQAQYNNAPEERLIAKRSMDPVYFRIRQVIYAFCFQPRPDRIPLPLIKQDDPSCRELAIDMPQVNPVRDPLRSPSQVLLLLSSKGYLTPFSPLRASISVNEAGTKDQA